MTNNQQAAQRLAEDFPQHIHALLLKYCLDCHDAETQEGKLDLSRFSSVATIAQEGLIRVARTPRSVTPSG